MRLGQILDPLAERLLRLRTVSSTQWQLRLLGAVATLLALVLAADPSELPWRVSTQLLSLVAVIGILLHARRPDSDLGLIAPLSIVVVASLHDGLTMLQAAGVGTALLLAHAAFALAATIPVHGLFGRDAWRLVAGAMLAVLGVSLVASLLIVLVSAVQLGAWMMVVGALAVIGLFVAVLPRAR